MAVPPAVAQAQDSETSSAQAESAIKKAAEEAPDAPTDEGPADPEADSPFVEAAKEPGVAPADLKQLLVPLTATELAGLAETWQRNLQGAVEKVVTLNLSLQGMDEAEAEKVREEIVAATDERGAIQDSYSTILDAWQLKGGAEENLKPHHDYLNALTVEVVKTTDFWTLLELGREWLLSRDGGIGILIKGLTLIFALYLMRYVAMFVRRLLRRGFDRLPDMSELLKRFILALAYWVTFAVGIMTVLAGFGVSIGPMVAVFGGLSFVLAFAMQDALGNIASGLMIMILKPFDQGDNVDIGGVAGIVHDMNIVSTTIRTFDNQFIIVPNSKIWNDVITNIDVADTRRVDMVFGIGYDDDSEKAKEILMDLCTGHEKVLDDPAPQVYVSALADSSVNINVRPWVQTADYWAVYWDILAAGKARFDAEGISIPYPQRDVHIIHDAVKPMPAVTQPKMAPAEPEPVSDAAGQGEEQEVTTPEN